MRVPFTVWLLHVEDGTRPTGFGEIHADERRVVVQTGSQISERLCSSEIVSGGVIESRMTAYTSMYDHDVQMNRVRETYASRNDVIDDYGEDYNNKTIQSLRSTLLTKITSEIRQKLIVEEQEVMGSYNGRLQDNIDLMDLRAHTGNSAGFSC